MSAVWQGQPTWVQVALGRAIRLHGRQAGRTQAWPAPVQAQAHPPDVTVLPGSGASSLTSGANVQLGVNKSQRQACRQVGKAVGWAYRWGAMARKAETAAGVLGPSRLPVFGLLAWLPVHSAENQPQLGPAKQTWAQLSAVAESKLASGAPPSSATPAAR